MSLPINSKKWQYASHVTPKAYIEYVKKKGFNTDVNTHRALFSWARSYTEDWLKNSKVPEKHVLSHKVYELPGSLVNANMGIGAPAAGVIFEEFIELGLIEFIGLGIAGALDPQLKPGDIVLCQEAIRDEGTSYHYLSAEEKTVSADSDLLNRVESLLKKENLPFVKGKSWTTDAPYRETKEEVIHYKNEGVLTVEMEASAIYSIAKARKVRAVSIFIVSDVLDIEVWEPHFHHKILKSQYQKVLEVICKHWGSGQ